MSIEWSSLTMDCTTLPMFKYYTLRCLTEFSGLEEDNWTGLLASPGLHAHKSILTYLYLPRTYCAIIKIMVGNLGRPDCCDSFQVSSWVQ